MGQHLTTACTRSRIASPSSARRRARYVGCAAGDARRWALVRSTQKLYMKNVFIIIVALTTIIVAGCQKQKTPTDTTVAVKPDAPTPAASAIREEPLSELTPQQFRVAWTAFTKDGRYRMAQTKEVAGMPYHGGFFNDILVIVVDQTLTNDSRFKLAYFRASENANSAYKLYWVNHDLDLAKSRVSNASSVLYIHEGGDPPTRSAPLKWDAKRKRYSCLANVAPNKALQLTAR
jgi:hypothetical protein